MNYVILPIEDANDIFGADRVQHMRHNVANTEVVVHESILLDRMVEIGMMVLTEPIEGEEPKPIEIPYPDYGHEDTIKLMSSAEWTSEDTL